MLIEAEGEGRRTGRVAGERKRLFVILQKAFARLQCVVSLVRSAVQGKWEGYIVVCTGYMRL